MTGSAESLYIQQLVELLAVVSSSTDEASAVQNAVERSAQAMEAEVAAAVVDGKVVASIGFPPDAVPREEIVAVTLQQRSELDVPGLGSCHATTASWAGSHPGHLVLARWGAPFQLEEQNLVRGMARVLELRPYLGDTWCFAMMDRMAHAHSPLLHAEPPDHPIGRETGLRLTDMGARVLAGTADHVTLNGIDRWIGGVHLRGYHVPWRWDDATETITRT